MKKILVAAAALIMFICPSRAFARTGAQLTDSVKININGKQAPSSLTDGYYTTKINTADTDLLTVEADGEIHSLYIIFDQPVSPYTISGENMQQTCGASGFIHEFIRLDKPQKKIEIDLPQGILCDIYIFGRGQLPDFVQQWQQPYEDCDMLLLPTHADDEHLYFGPVMPTYVDKGYKLQVAYLNNHWGEPYRPHELLNGLWTAGITAYPIIPQFNDMYSSSLEHAKTIYDPRRVEEYQVELMRRFKPEVIIAHDINGEYGHGTHMLNTDCLIRALPMAADETAFPESAQKYGTFSVPKTYIHLYRENSIVLDVDTPLETFGGKTAYQIAQEAFARHKSQQQWFSVEKSGPYDCRLFGLHSSQVGPDSRGGDLFENITDFSDDIPEPAPQPQSESRPRPDNTGGLSVNFYLIGGVLAAGLILIIINLKGADKNGKSKK